MAALEPFEPAVRGGSAGFTVNMSVAASAGAVTVALLPAGTAENPSILLTAWDPRPTGNTPIIAYLRMSVESSTAITPTVTDTPIVFIPQAAPQVRLFANPSPTGTCTIAVMATVSITAASPPAPLIFLTPGQGGLGP